jgi:3-deoxy-D-manno-octulosonic-acid transferase
MRYLYTFGILCYGFAIRLAALFSEKAKLWVQGRKDIMNIIQSKLADNKSEIAWFHASSLGEFEQCRPVIDVFRETYPNYKVLVTFFSPSGYEIRKNYPKADYVFYLPLDTPANARKFMDIVKPKIAFFVKYDFWFNYLNILNKRNVPMILFSSIFRPSQYFFKWYGGWFLKHLRFFTHAFVQNEQSEQLLKSFGVVNCSVAGDTRFDQVLSIASSPKQFPLVEKFVEDDKVILAGSSWEPDEILLKDVMEKSLFPKGVKLIVAPHEIHSERITSIENLFGSRCIRYSKMDISTSMDGISVLIIDNIGMLSSLYMYATVAYIGGGFGKGIHNILEALAYGKPVCFGPKYKKFQEAKDIIQLGGGVSVTTAAELQPVLESWLYSDEEYKQVSDVCKNYVQNNKGTSAKIMKILVDYSL